MLILKVNANKTCQVYLVIITSKDLLTRFRFITLRNNFVAHAQKYYKEKTLWENQKKHSKSPTLSKTVSCSKIGKLAKTKLYK